MSNWSTPFGSPQSTRGPPEAPSSRPAKYPAPRRGRRRAESLSHPRKGRWTESADILEDFAAELSAEFSGTKPGEDHTASNTPPETAEEGFGGTGYEGFQGGYARVPVSSQAGFGDAGPDGSRRGRYSTPRAPSPARSSRVPSRLEFKNTGYKGYQKFQGDQSSEATPGNYKDPTAPCTPPETAEKQFGGTGYKGFKGGYARIPVSSQTGFGGEPDGPQTMLGASFPPRSSRTPSRSDFNETGYTAGYQEVQKKYQYRRDQSRTPYPCSAHPSAPPNMPAATPAAPAPGKQTRADYEGKIEKMVRPYGLELKQSKKAEFCVNKGRGVWTRSREAKTVELSYLERDPASKTEARKYLCNESGSDEITALEKVYTELKKRGLHDYEQY